MKMLPFILFLLTFPAWSAYKGKLIDAVTQWPADKYKIEDLSKKISNAGVSKAGICITSFNISKETALKTSKAIDQHKIFFKGSPKYFHFASSLTNAKVDELMIEAKNNRYTFFSEIMYRHADKKQGLKTNAGERSIDPLSPQSLYLMTKISQNFPALPVFIHWEFYKWQNDYPKFSQLFKKYPELKFVINHLGFGERSQVEQLIKENPNVYFTISKRNSKFEYFKNAETFQGSPLLDKKKTLAPEWKILFEKYPERFIFATDSHKDYMWDVYSNTVEDYRGLLGQLPASVAEAIAYKNSEILFKVLN